MVEWRSVKWQPRTPFIMLHCIAGVSSSADSFDQRGELTMAYEKLEPHGELTIAGAKFAWDFYMRASVLNNDQKGNVVISPLLIQYQMVFMTEMAEGETRKRLLKCMHLQEEQHVDELMRWTLWCVDYFMREVALSYGTKPRAALVIARDREPKYMDGILPWINHYRTRKSYHVVRTLLGAEKQVNSITRRLTGAYPRDFAMENMFPLNTFTEQTRAIIASKLYFQLFLPSAGCVAEVSKTRLPFWRSPKGDGEFQEDEELLPIRTIKLLKRVERLENELCEIVGLDLYPANLSVYYILPQYSTRDGKLLNVNQCLLELERKLDGKKLHDYMQQMLPQRTRRVTEMMITLPCFHINTQAQLEQPMKNMGLLCLFDPTNGDWVNLFSDVGPNGGDFYLSIVKQDVDMQLLPTSTASMYYLKEQRPNQKLPPDWSGPQVTLNRPFLFFIYDHFSRAFLAFGRCQNPCDIRQ